MIFIAKIEWFIAFPGVYMNTLSLKDESFPELNYSYDKIQITYKQEEIAGMYINNEAEKTVYYFHGNGWDLSYFYADLNYISSLGYNVLALEYPGYGKSSWFPYEQTVNEFSRELYRFAQNRYSIREENTIIWGYSIGTGVASNFAVWKNIDALLLFAPYLSMYDMAESRFWFAVQKIFFHKNTFNSSDTIKKISVPKLIIHGTNDELIAFEQGKKLSKISGENTYFVEIPGGSHFRFWDYEFVDEAIKNFLEYRTTDRWEIEKIKSQIEAEAAQKAAQAYFKNLDFVSDGSLQKYVDSKIPFSKKSYVPSDMRRLSRSYISDTKWDAQMRTEAADHFESLAQDFYWEFKEKIVVVSSYRSYTYQAGIKAGGCPDNLCAKAWYSEHQSWLTADLWSASSDSYWKNSPRLMTFYSWLDIHAYKYGFTNSYKNGIWIDGYDIEPWHWRYVWLPLATKLHENQETFAEYFYKQEKE